MSSHFNTLWTFLKIEIRKIYSHELFWVAIIGVLLRFALMPYFSTFSDPYFWARSLIYFNNGYDPYALHLSVYPPFIYLFYSPFYRIIDGLGFSFPYFQFIPEFERSIGTPAFLILWKLPLLCFDLLTGFLIYSFVKDWVNSPKLPKIAFVIWIFNPLNLVITYMHGAWDVIVGFSILLGIFLIYKGNYLTGGLSFGIGTLAKLAPIYLVIPFSLIILLHGPKGPYFFQFRKNVVRLLKFLTGFIFPFLLSLPLIISYVNLASFLPFSSSDAFIWNNLNQWFFAAHPVGWQWVNSNLDVIQKLPFLYAALCLLVIVSFYKYNWLFRLSGEKLLLLGVLFGGLSYILYPSIIQSQYLLWYLPLLVCLLVVWKEFKSAFVLLSVAGIIYYFASAGPVTPLAPLAAYSNLLAVNQYLAWFNGYFGLPSLITGASFQKDLLFVSGFIGFLGLLILIYQGVKITWKINE